jgi:hypothetical protein
MFHIHATNTQRKKKKEEQTYLPVKDTSILISPLAGHQCSLTWEVRLCSPIALFFFSRSLFVSLVFSITGPTTWQLLFLVRDNESLL